MFHETDLDKIDLTQQPPEQEPERQYYYIAKCRQYVRNFVEVNGRRPTACVTTFGCQMNTERAYRKTA